jgi:hypothetical protein
MQAFPALVQQHVRFLQSLLVVMQQTGGQPSRGPELLSLKLCNTANSLRNLYIHRGLFCMLVPENKASVATQQPFWVAHYFPESVSQILYYYLVLIRPWVRYLEEQVLGVGLQQQAVDIGQPDYLWPALAPPPPSSREDALLEQKGQKGQNNIGLQLLQPRVGFWSTETMSSALKESCKHAGLPYELTTSSYRQLAIGIAKKHLLAPPLNNSIARRPKDQFQTGTELILQRLFA